MRWIKKEAAANSTLPRIFLRSTIEKPLCSCFIYHQWTNLSLSGLLHWTFLLFITDLKPIKYLFKGERTVMEDALILRTPYGQAYSYWERPVITNIHILYEALSVLYSESPSHSQLHQSVSWNLPSLSEMAPYKHMEHWFLVLSTHHTYARAFLDLFCNKTQVGTLFVKAIQNNNLAFSAPFNFQIICHHHSINCKKRNIPDPCCIVYKHLWKGLWTIRGHALHLWVL